MFHRLRIIASLGLDIRWAELKVTGCLTPDSCAALVPLIRRCSSLGFSVHVNLSLARHIGRTALTSLQDGSVLASVRATNLVRATSINKSL